MNPVIRYPDKYEINNNFRVIVLILPVQSESRL